MKIHKTILPIVLYENEMWYLTLREECRLNVHENRILSRIFRPKRDANEEWRRLNNEQLNNLYRSPYMVRMIKSRKKIKMGRSRSQNGRR